MCRLRDCSKKVVKSSLSTALAPVQRKIVHDLSLFTDFATSFRVRPLLTSEHMWWHTAHACLCMMITIWRGAPVHLRRGWWVAKTAASSAIEPKAIRRMRAIQSARSHCPSGIKVTAAVAVPRGVDAGAKARLVMEGVVSIQPGSVLIGMTKAWRSRESGWRATHGCKTISTAVGRGVHASHATHVSLVPVVRSADSKRVLGKAQSNAALGAVVERVAVKLLECLGGEANLLELNEAHGSLRLRSKTQSFVTTLFREDGFELLLISLQR